MNRPFFRLLLASAAAAFILPAAGCYQRVVNAKGYGADRMQVTPASVPSDGDKINGFKRLEHRRLPG
jgi:hypothetical protein